MDNGRLPYNMYVRATDKTMKTSAGGIMRACRQGGVSAMENQGSRLLVSSVSISSLDGEELRACFFRCINELYAGNARPVSLMVSGIIPCSLEESGLRKILAFLDGLCFENELVLLNGSIEAADINKPAFCLSGYGYSEGGDKIKPQEGCGIICAGSIAGSGMGIIISREKERLLGRFSESFLKAAEKKAAAVSIKKYAELAGNNCLMIPASEGGIMSALWDLKTEPSGFFVDIREIPVYQEIVEISEFLEINPYKLLSDGCVLIISAEYERVLEELKRTGACASLIGMITEGAGGSIKKDDEISCISRPDPDEIFRFLNSK